MNKDKLKNGLIIALVVILVLGGIFGGRAVKRFTAKIDALQSSNYALKNENAERDKVITSQLDTIKSKDVKIEKLMEIFRIKDKQIAGLTKERDEAIAELEGITADSSYQFLQEVAYVLTGTLKYPFNENQVKAIHSDYLMATSARQLLPVMMTQLDDCQLQFSIRDSIEYSLKKVVSLQKQNLDNCEKVNTNNDKILKDTEKQRDAEKRRKNFWRFTASVAGGIAVVLAVFGL